MLRVADPLANHLKHFHDDSQNGCMYGTIKGRRPIKDLQAVQKEAMVDGKCFERKLLRTNEALAESSYLSYPQPDAPSSELHFPLLLSPFRRRRTKPQARSQTPMLKILYTPDPQEKPSPHVLSVFFLQQGIVPDATRTVSPRLFSLELPPQLIVHGVSLLQPLPRAAPIQ